MPACGVTVGAARLSTAQKNLRVIPVSNAEEAMELLARGARLRRPEFRLFAFAH
jgi:hypothetical protein